MALSTISTSSYTPGDTTTGDNNNDSSIYQLLLDRCRSLEASYANLQEQFHMLEQEQTLPSTQNVNHHHHGKLLHDAANVSSSSYNDWISVPDVLPVGFSYKRALDQLGHAVYVSKADTREIIYWNRSAEKLFGYEHYEALGQTVSDLLIYDEFHISSEKILARVRSGQNWAGQFPFRKRSGVTFMALVNKSPLYEDGELVGIVTVASDATIFNKIKSENSRPAHEDDHSNGQRSRGLNFKKIQWQPPQQLSSFVSNLKSKDILRKGGGNDRHAQDASMDVDRNIQDHENVTVEKPPKAPPKRGFGFSLWKKATGNDNEGDEVSEPANYAAKVAKRDHLAVSTFQYWRREMELEHDLNSKADCEIQWEDLIFKEEMRHGSFARVYRGLWNGSVNPYYPEADVAVKVYFGNQYSEKVLQDYNKEIDIMKRLRHPNVLLYMGSVCSQDKLAMVTELLPRGSLFNVLHNSGHNLDIKRRLRMAADVARGMNYLHHRNPPIVHRDLKSSNLLVDKNWSVKVGDFGLSKLKHATFLTARSGRGTPQWMAPEVLRNEPSNEKSDVFSFGIILWELVTQRVPWNNMNPLQVVGIVGFMDRRLDLPEDIDPSLSSIIQDCWQSNPTLRPSFENIMLRLPGIMQNLPG
ncbi:PAS domain-containing protein tyrosine kinase family protein [Tanacetum coccineum]